MVSQATQVEDTDIKQQNSMQSRSKNEQSFHQNTTSRSHISKQHDELPKKSNTNRDEAINLKLNNIAPPSTLSPPPMLSPTSPMEDYSNMKKLLASSVDEDKTNFLRQRFEEIIR